MTGSDKSSGPVLFDLEDAPQTNPSEAPPVPDMEHPPAPNGQAMATLASLAGRKPSKLGRWFWGLFTGLIGTLISIAAWNYATALVAANPILGWIVTALIVTFVLVCLVIVVRELAALMRLSRVDRLRHQAAEAIAQSDLIAARGLGRDLSRLYAGRDDTKWGRARLKEREGDVFDAVSYIDLIETDLLGPLDIAARKEVEAGARQVAVTTALVPLALADVVTALTVNVRMIRRIAEIYGGRSGLLGGWRLTRAVLSHLVATGAIAIGDDMLEPILGSGLMGKLSRRFGEGLVNGALTARVGAAAMEVCRPLPFSRQKRPPVRRMMRAALGGLVTNGKSES